MAMATAKVIWRKRSANRVVSNIVSMQVPSGWSIKMRVDTVDAVVAG